MCSHGEKFRIKYILVGPSETKEATPNTTDPEKS
jgi:hypothetical protein